MHKTLWTLWTLMALAILFHICPAEKSSRNTQVDCLARCIPPQMIRQMLNTLKEINRSIPYVNKGHHRHQRFVPKICTKNLNAINKILEIYEYHVLLKLWNRDTKDPNTLTHNFSKLKDCVERCKDLSHASFPRDTKRMIRQMEKKFNMMSENERWSSLGDLRTVLEWIGFYIDRKPHPNKCLKSSLR